MYVHGEKLSQLIVDKGLHIMGIYDRDYIQDDQRTYRPLGGGGGGGGMMMVNRLVIINFVIFFVDAFSPGGHWISEHLLLRSDVYLHPWQCYQLLTYGFVHTPLGISIWHVAGNMFMLWMFGREVELRLGRREFLTFYLSAVVFAGLVWLVATDLWLFTSAKGAAIRAAHDYVGMLGASGAVMAVFVLFVLYDPHRTLYIWGVLAVPAWLIGLIIVGMNALNGLNVHLPSQDNVAWQTHLGGVAFAYFYFRNRWNLSRWVPNWNGMRMPRLGPKLKVRYADDDAELDAEADRVLDKVHREGLDSLTARERRVLERHSRRMRQRRGR